MVDPTFIEGDVFKTIIPLTEQVTEQAEQATEQAEQADEDIKKLLEF